MRPLLVALLLLPAVGYSQSTLAITVSGSGTSGTLAYNASGCGNLVAGGWVGTGLTTACTSLNIWTTAFTCGTAPSTTNSPPDIIVSTVTAGSLLTTTSGTFSFAFNTLPSFASNTCGAAVDFTNSLCAGVQLPATDGSCTGTTVNGNPIISLRYDNVPPVPPTLTITPLDSQLSVRLTSGDSNDTILSFQLQYAVEPPDGGTPAYRTVSNNIPANNPTVIISNLTNDQNYLLQGNSVDEATNVSAASEPVVGTPVLTLGFYSNYIRDGGQPGGCGDEAGGGPSALAFATTLVLLLVARRRG